MWPNSAWMRPTSTRICPTSPWMRPTSRCASPIFTCAVRYSRCAACSSAASCSRSTSAWSRSARYCSSSPIRCCSAPVTDLDAALDLPGDDRDPVLQLGARLGVPALDAGGVELRQREAGGLDRMRRLRVEVVRVERGDLVRRARGGARRAGERREVAVEIARRIASLDAPPSIAAPRRPAAGGVDAGRRRAARRSTWPAARSSAPSRRADARRGARGNAPSADATIGTPDCSATDSVYAYVSGTCAGEEAARRASRRRCSCGSSLSSYWP